MINRVRKMNQSKEFQFSESSGFDEFDKIFDLDQPITSNHLINLTENILYDSQLNNIQSKLARIETNTNQNVEIDSGLSQSYHSQGFSYQFEITNSFEIINTQEGLSEINDDSIIDICASAEEQLLNFNSSNELIECDMETNASNKFATTCNSTNSEQHNRLNRQPKLKISMQMTVSDIPTSIVRLYQSMKENHSDYSFAHAFAAQMCQQSFPMDCYNSLKLGLLLSIISLNVCHLCYC